MAETQPLNDDDRANLVAYLDGELNEMDARTMETKLHQDPHVRAEADAMRRTWELLDYLPRPEPSAGFTHRTMDRLSVMRTVQAKQSLLKRRWLLGVGWAAVLLIAAVGSYAAAPWFLPQGNDAGLTQAEIDRRLTDDFTVIDNLTLYRHVDDIHFLNELDQPDRFGDENAGY